MKKYDWILFDADNTLFDFHIASQKSFRDLINELGQDYSPDLYDIYHHINLDVWHLFEQDKINSEELRALRFKRFFDHMGYIADATEANTFYLEHLVVHSTIYPTTMAMLDRLMPDYKLAIITNGLKEVQRPRIRKLALDPYFDAIIVSDEIGHSKPNAGYFDHVFDEIKHPDKSRVLVVGDSLRSDIQGGKGYGLDTCWYNPGKNANFSKITADFEIHDHGEIYRCL